MARAKAKKIEWNTSYCRRPNKVRAPLSQSRYFDYRGYLEKLLREAWERDFAEFEFDVWRRALKTPAGQRYLASLNVDDRLFEQKEADESPL